MTTKYIFVYAAGGSLTFIHGRDVTVLNRKTSDMGDASQYKIDDTILNTAEGTSTPLHTTSMLLESKGYKLHTYTSTDLRIKDAPNTVMHETLVWEKNETA